MNNPDLIKLVSSTSDGQERELKILEDICISCVNISLVRYCLHYQKMIYGAVKVCHFYCNNYYTLDKFLKQEGKEKDI